VTLSLSAACVAWIGCAPPPEAGGVGETAPPPETLGRVERPVPVRVRELEADVYVDRFEVTGIVAPWREYVLGAEFGGLVREVAFDRGDRVARGQVLARVGDDLARARLDQSSAELMASEANFVKVSKLAEREAVPRQDLVAATARRDRDRAVVVEAEARLDRATIRSPVDGSAAERYVDPGEVAAPGAAVARIQEAGRLKLEAAVPDTEIGWLAVGGPIAASFDAWPARSFEGRIRFVATSADPVTRTFTVEAELPNRELVLRPGMIARVQLVRRTIEDAVTVPQDALVTRVEGAVAFVVEDCRARLRSVVIGGSENGTVLILDGLEAGEALVVEGQRDLADGQPVRSEDCP
jgi:membrane fusion protein (multidrug efflux system)